MAVYELENGNFVISDDGGWLPGVYADRNAAELALTLPYSVLHKLNESIDYNQKAAITVDDLNNANNAGVLRGEYEC